MNCRAADGDCWRAGKWQKAKQNKAASNLPQWLLSLSLSMRKWRASGVQTPCFCTDSDKIEVYRKPLKMHPSNATTFSPKNLFYSSPERDSVLLWRVFSVTSSFHFVRLSSTLFWAQPHTHTHTAPTVITSQKYRHRYDRYMHTYVATIQRLNRWR